MKKETSRFTAVGGEYLGKVPPTKKQKKDAEKIVNHLSSIVYEDEFT